jgi:alpha-1,3/alpha-1,6-mannosyltransferase
VVVAGSFFHLIPRSIFNRFLAVLANLRTLICTLWMICYGPQFDAVVCDQVSISLPLLKLFRYRTIFYCHFPDKLLSGKRGFIKSIYRFFIDLWEEICIWFADLVYVNSRYTQGIFYKHFPLLNRLKVKTEILYPAIDFSKFNIGSQAPLYDKPYFVSLNRYERKKNIPLAIEAFSKMSPKTISSTYLVIAGGYDERVTENVEHHQELVNLAAEKKVSDQVRFMRNVSDKDRVNLLKNCIATLYTPEN